MDRANGVYFSDQSESDILEAEDLRQDNVLRLPIEIVGQGVLTSPDIEDCPICAEPMEDGHEARVLRCAHWFHRECLETWSK